jgi:hypothetical protein
MGPLNRTVAMAAILIPFAAALACAAAGPFDGKTFRGRIAYSADGNFNDPDDWFASPVALAILAGFGMQDKLVHFDYNAILPKTDPEWEKTHETSVLGAAERYGYPGKIFHDCQKDLPGVIASLRHAINASSADNPLYLIAAGPMEVDYRAIVAADPEKRKFVYVISHSRWNDGFGTKLTFEHNKRSVIPLGIHWVQIADQNKLLSTSPYGRLPKDEEWTPWHWMRDSKDPKLQFQWERARASTRPDCSDAGMAYFLMTGDEKVDPEKLRKLLVDKVAPRPVAARDPVRLEAENFATLEGYELEDRGDRNASHRLQVKLSQTGAGRIRTTFDEPYTAAQGQYDVDVRYFDKAGTQCSFRLFSDSAPQGAAWPASLGTNSWQTHTVAGVSIRAGGEITVEATGDSAESCRLDYVQLNRR